MSDKMKTFAEFYPFYLSQHQNKVCRQLHFVGSSLVLGLLAAYVLHGQLYFLIAMPVAGYGFAWVGHFFFEKNRPATFTYPFYSLMGDWVMYWDLLTGNLPFGTKTD